MEFYEQEASEPLQPWIKSFWQIERRAKLPIISDKIVPDGYPELIFHYGNPYQINTTGSWEKQSEILLAGQFTHFFHLENTGSIGMFAIKLQPWTPALWFQYNMSTLTNKVLDLSTMTDRVMPLLSIATTSMTFEEKCCAIEEWVLKHKTRQLPNEGALACKEIIARNGKASVSQIVVEAGISERSLERYFKRHIGLTPKLYSRIIRLAHVFKLVREDHNNWAQLSYLGGFYDQAHFIKDFKTFTGEEPSKYGFDKINMANFFLH